jgi:hypothetical protein
MTVVPLSQARALASVRPAVAAIIAGDHPARLDAMTSARQISMPGF